MTIQLFRDKDFPPCISSIAPPPEEDAAKRKLGDGIKWLRPRQIALPPGKKPMLFSGNPSPSQIEQGRLGDCWFVGALATVCTFNEFNNLELNYIPVEGKVTLKIYKQGQWRQMEIDDLLPCDAHGRLLFTSSTDPGIYWMSFIEKAYAKLHGSYFALNKGNPCDAMADLTGGVGTNVDLDFTKKTDIIVEDTKEYKELFVRLEAYTELCIAAICTSTSIEKYGIISDHAYSVMLALRVHTNEEEEIKMILFRNPHGTGTRSWTGPYAKSDTQKWSNIKTADRKKLFDLLDKDGYIWTDFKTFCLTFETLNICNLPGKLKYDFQVFADWKGAMNPGFFVNPSNKSPYQPNIYLKVAASDKSRRVLIALSQRDPRLRVKDGEIDAKCHAVGIVVMKYPSATVVMPGRVYKYDTSLLVAESETWNRSREILLEHIFEPGPDLELCIIPSTSEPGISDVFRVRCMSANELVLKSAPPFDEYWMKESLRGTWDPNMKTTNNYPKYRFRILTDNRDVRGKGVPVDIVMYQRESDPQYVGIKPDGEATPVLVNSPVTTRRVIAKVEEIYSFMVPCYNPQSGQFIIDICLPRKLAEMMKCKIQIIPAI